MSEELEHPETLVKLNVSGRTVYAALRNLLQHHYGLTKEVVISKMLESADIKTWVKEWMNGSHIRQFVGETAIKVVREMADPIIRAEVKKAVEGKIQITINKE